MVIATKRLLLILTIGAFTACDTLESMLMGRTMASKKL